MRIFLLPAGGFTAQRKISDEEEKSKKKKQKVYHLKGLRKKEFGEITKSNLTKNNYL